MKIQLIEEGIFPSFHPCGGFEQLPTRRALKYDPNPPPPGDLCVLFHHNPDRGNNFCFLSPWVSLPSDVHITRDDVALLPFIVAFQTPPT